MPFSAILLFTVGLDSRDQSRSRSRMSFVLRLAFLKCQDFLDGRDWLCFSWSKFFKLRFFNWDLSLSRYLSRLSRRIEIVEICQDALRLSRFVEMQSRFVEKSWHCWGLLSPKMMKSLNGLRNLDKKIQKSTHFSIEIETNCWEMPKFSDLDKFLDLDWDFLVWTLMSRQNQEVLISISWLRYLDHRD